MSKLTPAIKEAEATLQELRKAQKTLLPLLLTEIKSAIQQVEQWHEAPFADGFADNTAGYFHQLEALVELLEIYDCGSTGGFGKDQPDNLNLKERADWLLKKYKNIC